MGGYTAAKNSRHSAGGSGRNQVSSEAAGNLSGARGLRQAASPSENPMTKSAPSDQIRSKQSSLAVKLRISLRQVRILSETPSAIRTNPEGLSVEALP